MTSDAETFWKRHAPAPVPPDAGFRERPRGRLFPRGSNSSHRPACCRPLYHLANQLVRASGARQRCRAPARACLQCHRANGSCGTASPEKPERPGAPELCALTRYAGGDRDRRSTHPSPDSMAYADPSCVKAPSVTAISRIVSTATGLRLQLFSPSPAKNGSAEQQGDPDHRSDH